MLIYLITNLVNGKFYVGQTRLSWIQRWRQHVRDSRTGETLMARAIRKYGADRFSVSVLCECSTQGELDAKEIEYIANLETHASKGKGYNITLGGFGGQHGTVAPFKDKKHSPETRTLMRESRLGKPHPHNKDQRGLKNAMFGRTWGWGLLPRKHTKETRAQMSKSQTGKPCPARGVVHKGRKQTAAHVAARVATRKATLVSRNTPVIV